MAINDMILPGVKNPLLAVAEEIRKQISAKALEQPKTSPPIAGMPEDRDYAEGMQRPELTTLKGEREFKATPSRTSAFLVALGNILQDKQNLEAAKQQTEQNEYNAKLADAMEMNKLFKTGKMKREFDESDPDVLLGRKLKEQSYQQNEELFPLRLQRERTGLDRLLAKGTGGGRSRASGGREVISNIPKPGLSAEQQKIYDSLKTKAAQDKYYSSIVTPDKAKEVYNELRNRSMALGNDLKELSKEFKNATSDDVKATIANRYRASEQNLIQNDMEMQAFEQDYGIKRPTATDVKSKIPTPSTKKSLKDRAAELKAQNKTREETEAILTQEGY